MEKQQNFEDDFEDNEKVEVGNFVFWDFNITPEIIGIFLRWEKDNFGEHAVIKTQDEDELHLSNLVSLNGKLNLKEVSENDKVKIVHLGEKKSKNGRMYNDFDVYVKK